MKKISAPTFSSGVLPPTTCIACAKQERSLLYCKVPVEAVHSDTVHSSMNAWLQQSFVIVVIVAVVVDVNLARAASITDCGSLQGITGTS